MGDIPTSFGGLLGIAIASPFLILSWITLLILTLRKKAPKTTHFFKYLALGCAVIINASAVYIFLFIDAVNLSNVLFFTCIFIVPLLIVIICAVVEKLGFAVSKYMGTFSVLSPLFTSAYFIEGFRQFEKGLNETTFAIGFIFSGLIIPLLIVLAINYLRRNNGNN